MGLWPCSFIVGPDGERCNEPGTHDLDGYGGVRNAAACCPHYKAIRDREARRRTGGGS